MQFLDAIPLFWQGLSRLRVSKDCFAPFLSQRRQSHKISQTEDIGWHWQVSKTGPSGPHALLRPCMCARFAILSVLWSSGSWNTADSAAILLIWSQRIASLYVHPVICNYCRTISFWMWRKSWQALWKETASIAKSFSVGSAKRIASASVAVPIHGAITVCSEMPAHG